jgi:hypothetical protein
MFHVVRSTSKILYLASPQDEPYSFKLKQNKNVRSPPKKFLPSVLDTCRSLLKRKLFGEKEDDDYLHEGKPSSPKRPKISENPEESIQLALINPQECVHLINYHASQVLELKEEFLHKETGYEIQDGVTKSPLLKLGSVHTVFILLQPKSYTEYSNCNFDLNFILYEGESVVVKTMRCDENDKFHENDPTIETEPFKLPLGSFYSLENNHGNQNILLRIFWVQNPE